MTKQILVTGGAGFIGSSFVRQAIKNNNNVIVLDALTYAGNTDNLSDVKNNIEFIKGNICDGTLILNILQKHNIDSIINFAAESHVDNSINSPAIFIETNINGTYQMLEASRQYFNKLDHNQKNNFRYIQVSTDEVFGSLELNDKKFNEESNYKPNSPYSASKAAGDHLARAWFETYGLPVITTNCSNNYGPRQYPEKLIPLMIKNAIAGKKLPIYGDGSNIRDWIHVDDHCEGIDLALEKGIPGQTYCFGGNAEKSNLELVTLLCETLDRLKPKNKGSYKDQISFVQDRAGHDKRYAINDSKAIKELGFKRKYNFKDGLEDTIKWYLKI